MSSGSRVTIGPGRIAQARADLAARGAAVLPGFIAPPAAARMLAEIEPQLGRAFDKLKTHNVYLLADDPEFAPDHPRNRKVSTSSATLAYDLVPEGALRRLYLDQGFRADLAKILGHDRLYPYADPLAGLNVLIYPEGAEIGWHFDNANFVVTIMLRPAETGGDYQYIPGSRSETDDGFEVVATALDGRADKVLSLSQSAGDLVIFQGRNTLHRVTPVTGLKPRVIAVFSYDPEPGKILHEDTRKTFYGRTA